VIGEFPAMKIRALAEGLGFPEGPVALADGSVLLVEIFAGTLTRVRPDGTKTIVARPGGGPNGAALGPDGKCYICKNGGFRAYRGVAPAAPDAGRRL
jgi:gluconolactonase